jgi:hypothetical protein
VNGCAGRHVCDVLRLLQRLEQLVLGQRDVVSNLRNAPLALIAIAMLALLVTWSGAWISAKLSLRPKAYQRPFSLQPASSASGDGLGAVFRVADELGPDLRLVIKGRHRKGHNTPNLTEVGSRPA